MSERSEQPTPGRLRQARRKGQVPRSRLFLCAASAAGGLGALLATAPSEAVLLRAFTVRALSGSLPPAEGLLEAGRVLARIAGPVLASALTAGALSALLTTGFAFELGALAPRFERVDPLAGLRRIFSAAAGIELLKGLLAAGILTWVVWRAVLAAAPGAFRLPALPGAAAAKGMLIPLGRIAARAALSMLALGAADLLLARWKHRRSLRMTREEVKEEYRQSEGDPRHRAERKALHRHLALAARPRGVGVATAVVVNPTHVAVALRYASDECEAPYLVARGREGDAQAIRREAVALGIPVVRDVALARSLVDYDVGEEIPEELYRAAAAVLQAAAEARPAAKANGPR